MDALISFFNYAIEQTRDDFSRFMLSQIQWNQRMLAIKGPRGSGKTTMLLQRIKFGLGKTDKALYASADNAWFYTHSLLELAEEFYKHGGEHLFIDEVHKYPGWSRELKNIYDSFPTLKIVFSASSALDIYRGESDMSRRVITYLLPGLSFREFIEFKYKFKFPVISLGDILNNHGSFTRGIVQKIKPILLFSEYLEAGYYPYFTETDKTGYFIKINQTLNTVIESDLASTEGYNAGSVIKLKKLLGVIAESVPFQPNISALARKLDISRDSVYYYLHLLQNAKILNFTSSSGKGISTLQKPDKIFLENPNLNFALREQPDKGNLRETFFLNQLLNSGHKVHLPKEGDFLVNKEYLFEIGGKSKDFGQLKNSKNSFIAADDIEFGFGKKIPLWLFGFLY